MRWVLQRMALLVLLFGGYLVVTGVQVYLTSRHHDARPAQAIVVMGAAQYNGVPSPDLVARLQDASGLWHRQLAGTVVVTGSRKPADKYTEAQASEVWLVAHGVPSAHIVEVGGDDSWTNLSLAATALQQRGLTKILIVTDGFHEDRCLAIASNLGLQAWPVPASHSPIRGWAAIPYYAKETLGVGLGRVVGYSRLHRLG